MRIGQIAGQANVSTKTIRYYESIGLLPEPERLENGYRDYDERAVDRLGFIRDAQASGLSLDEISAIVDLRDQGSVTCGHVTALLEQHLADLDRHIADLRRTRKELAAMTERAKVMDPTTCTDPNRCQTIVPTGRRSGDLAADLHHRPHKHAH